MKTSLKTGAAQIFSCCPQNTRELENLPGVGGGGGAAAPPSPHGLYAPLNETKKDKLFFKQLRSSYLLGWGKNISLS